MIEKLSRIQSKLKAPKNNMNKFGGYKYRSCEDILESVKPLLSSEGLALIITDHVVQVGDRYYIKAVATVKDKDGETSVEGWAREEENKKGMDSMQLTGATSSYARKYALNGLFAIDDTKDSDATNDHGKEPPKTESKPQPSGKISEPQQKRMVALAKGKKPVISEVLKEYGYQRLSDIEKKDYDKMCEKAEFLA